MNSRERFRLKLGKIASQIESHRLERFKFLCKDSIPEGDLERISSPEALFIELEHRMLGEDKTWTPGPWTPNLDQVHGPL